MKKVSAKEHLDQTKRISTLVENIIVDTEKLKSDRDNLLERLASTNETIDLMIECLKYVRFDRIERERFDRADLLRLLQIVKTLNESQILEATK